MQDLIWMLHAKLRCRPCAWFWKPQGCQNDKDPVFNIESWFRIEWMLIRKWKRWNVLKAPGLWILPLVPRGRIEEPQEIQGTARAAAPSHVAQFGRLVPLDRWPPCGWALWFLHPRSFGRPYIALEYFGLHQHSRRNALTLQEMKWIEMELTWIYFDKEEVTLMCHCHCHDVGREHIRIQIT